MLGTIIASQSFVSSTVCRHPMRVTTPFFPLSSCTQSPTAIDPSTWRATPITLLSVACSESARIPVTTALVVTIPVSSSPAVRSPTRSAAT